MFVRGNGFITAAADSSNARDTLEPAARLLLPGLPAVTLFL